MSSIQIPCVKYGSTFDPTTLTTVKINKFVNNTNRSKKFPQFRAKHGVEGLFYVVDQFKKNGRKLEFEVIDYWNNFDEVLDTVAEAKWDAQIESITPNQRTEARFNREVLEFIGTYAEDPNPRDVMLKYLKSSHCKKDVNISPQDHSDCLEVLINFTNRLQGTEPEVDEENKKKIIFESFPTSWQTDYKKSGHPEPDESTLTRIIAFMNLCKLEADRDHLQRKNKRQKVEHIRGGGPAQNNARCNLPEHEKDLWKDCSFNPRSKNFRGRTYDFNRNFNRAPPGQSGGRFNAGRGNFGGRHNFPGRGYFGGRTNNFKNHSRGYDNRNNNNNNGNQFQNKNQYNSPQQGSYYNNDNIPNNVPTWNFPKHNHHYYNQTQNNNEQSKDNDSPSWN